MNSLQREKGILIKTIKWKDTRRSCKQWITMLTIVLRKKLHYFCSVLTGKLALSSFTIWSLSYTDVGGAKEATDQLCQEVCRVRIVVNAAPFSWKNKQTTHKQWCRRRSVSRTRTQPWRVSGTGFICSACSLSWDTGGETVQGVVLRTGESPAITGCALTRGSLLFPDSKLTYSRKFDITLCFCYISLTFPGGSWR